LFVFALILLPAASPAAATPAITKIGALIGSFGKPYTITLTGGAAAGTIVGVGCASNADNGGTAYALTTSDSGSNSYTTRGQQLDSGNHNAVSWVDTLVTGALISGNTITFNPAVDGAWNCLVYNITGNAASAPLDKVVKSNGTFNATYTSPTLTPSQQPEIAILIAGGTGTFSSYGNIIGAAATGLDNVANGAGRNIQSEWRELTATTAGTATMNYTAKANNSGVFVTYKESAGGPTCANRIALMGAGCR